MTAPTLPVSLVEDAPMITRIDSILIPKPIRDRGSASNRKRRNESAPGHRKTHDRTRAEAEDSEPAERAPGGKIDIRA